MQPDEVLRLDSRKCIALFQGQKPALLYKLTPEELPDYGKLQSYRVLDYTPDWKQKESEQAAKRMEQETSASKKASAPPKPSQPEPPSSAPLEKGDTQIKDYSFPELMKKSPLVELTMDKVRGDKKE